MNKSELINKAGGITGIFFAFFLIITGITILPILENLNASQMTLFFYSISIVCAAVWVIFLTVESSYNFKNDDK